MQSSTAVAPGQLYVFLSEGTLVIASPNGTPALGSWKQENQTITMREEGLAYAVEILELTQDRFRIRMRNPGEPVEMIPVDDQTGVFQAQYFETLAHYRREFNRDPPDDIWSIPKFKSSSIKKGNYKPGNKRTDSIPDASVGADTPLYMFFGGDADGQAHSAFDGFAGGGSGGAGAGASWADDTDHHGDSFLDSGGLGADTDSGFLRSVSGSRTRVGR